ncbi:hypothetical protein ACJX0J_015928, partial [Zea mays]
SVVIVIIIVGIGIVWLHNIVWLNWSKTFLTIDEEGWNDDSVSLGKRATLMEKAGKKAKCDKGKEESSQIIEDKVDFDDSEDDLLSSLELEELVKEAGGVLMKKGKKPQ